MDFSKFKRDANKVKAALKPLPNKSVMATKECRIYVPTRYREKNFANIGSTINILGIFMMTHGDSYCVNNVISMMRIEPSLINEIKIGEEDYIEFIFNPGDLVFANINLVKYQKLPYYVYDEFLAKGNLPFYFSYSDALNLFKSTNKHCGISFASSPTILHMLITSLTRNSDDLHQQYREIANGKNEDKLSYIGITSNIYSANNTTSRVLGAHFTDNVTTALVNESKDEQNIEHILRM